MAQMKLDKSAFTKIILIIGVLLIIAVGALVFFGLGGPALFSQKSASSSDTLQYSYDLSEKIQVPREKHSFSWKYGSSTYTVSVAIDKNTYRAQNRKLGDIPESLKTYTDLAQNDSSISELTSSLLSIAKSKGFSEKETRDFILSFASSIPYKTDIETNHSSEYPRTPVVTLADGAGDSLDLAILACSLLKKAGFAEALLYYPESMNGNQYIPNSAAVGIIEENFSYENPVYCIRPANETDYAAFAEHVWFDEEGPYCLAEAVWVADVFQKGTPVSAYFLETPVVIFDSTLFSGKPGASFSGDVLNFEQIIDLNLNTDLALAGTSMTGGKLWKRGYPIQIPLYLEGMNPNLQYYHVNEKAVETMSGKWYSSGVGWSTTSREHWNIYEHFLNINPASSVLYTPAGTAVFTTEYDWRLVYQVKSATYDYSGEMMTPFANFCIAVYRIDDTGNYDLVEITGWNGHSDADEYGISHTYSPGRYAVGIFSRNVDAVAEIQFYGHPANKNQARGI